MWFLGAIIGMIIGGAFGGFGWLLGAIAGGYLGTWLERQGRIPDTEEEGLSIHDRLRLVESEVKALRREVELLRGSPPAQPAPAVSPAIPEAAPPPPDTAPQPAPAALPAPVELGEAPAILAVNLAPELTEEPPRPNPEPAQPRLAGAPDADIPFALEPPDWARRLWAINPLAKIGIVLLFFGVASALRLAVDYGLFPVPLRLFLAAAGGMALVAFGYASARNPEHRTFGLSLQGGGFAVLYLVVYFMLDRYAMVGQGLAFTLFAIFGVACVFFAAAQDGPALAVLGLSGAFLAPVLAGGRADSPLPLFSYFTLLNAVILGVDWFKSWRVLNIAGFFFTLALGMVWAVANYHQQHYLVTQCFVVLFLAIYSAMPVATALLRAPGLSGWRDGILLFGTPLAGGFLQAWLMADVPYGLAWSALFGSLWYFALWALLFRRSQPENRLLERSHLAIAIALLTVSVPLGFDAQVTSAFWAVEGSVVLWFGVRQGRSLAQYAGLLMQLAAGFALLLGWHGLEHRLPVVNAAVLGAFILVATGLFAARLLRHPASDVQPTALPPPSLPPLLPLIWALLWWLGTGLAEIDRFAPTDLQLPYGLLFATATVLLLEVLAGGWHWPELGTGSLLLLLALGAATLGTIARSGHPYAGLMGLVLPVALAVHYALLARHESLGNDCCLGVRHLLGWWLVLLSLAWELAWQAQQLAPAPDVWSYFAVVTVLAAGLALPALGVRRWPFAVEEAAYLSLGILPPLLFLILCLPWGCFHFSGADGLHWPYLPLLNVFDAVQLAGLGALLLLARQMPVGFAPLLRGLAGALAFVWFSTLAGRIAHHWGGVPFDTASLMASNLFQALLTLFWTVTAIGTMIFASRRMSREWWFGGMFLLGLVGAKLLLFDAAGRGTLAWTGTLLGVALLVLAASYFAPLPPPAEGEEKQAP
ncbi:MAG TPA: DUF2339 domain-containing protein [Azospira sp.]|nr:DUF2339 domain-containing protein [Azospira sp.]